MDFECQHIIPQVYLRRWAAPNLGPGRKGQVWVIQKDDLTKKAPKSPKSIFWKSDHYTIRNGPERDLRVENALGTIEKDLPKVHAKLDKNESITGLERVILTFFTAAMLSRVEAQANWMADSLREDRDQVVRLEAKHGIEPVASSHLENELRNVNSGVVIAGLMHRANMLWRMNLSIFTTDDALGFVTSDNPCSVVVPGAWPAFIGHRNVEITLPLTPQHLAFYSWLAPPIMYQSFSADQVANCNMRTIGQSEREFVSWRGEVRDSWFLPEAA
jgi:hypothetical protein